MARLLQINFAFLAGTRARSIRIFNHRHVKVRHEPFNSTPMAGQFDFVRLPARTPHGGASYAWRAQRSHEKYPPVIRYRSFSRAGIVPPKQRARPSRPSQQPRPPLCITPLRQQFHPALSITPSGQHQALSITPLGQHPCLVPLATGITPSGRGSQPVRGSTPITPSAQVRVARQRRTARSRAIAICYA